MSTDDERWGDWSAQHWARAFVAGPVLINPVIYVELSVRFDRIEMPSLRVISPT